MTTTQKVREAVDRAIANHVTLYQALEDLFPALYEETYNRKLKGAEAYARSRGLDPREALKITSPATYAEYWRRHGNIRRTSSYPVPTPDYRKVLSIPRRRV